MASRIKDRIEALRRLPSYQDDYAKWLNISARVTSNGVTWKQDLAELKTFERMMLKKWKLRSPFPPPGSIPLEEWDRLRSSQARHVPSGASLVPSKASSKENPGCSG